jgi:uncharacterized protein YndB with AHSA1/START domain
MTAGTQERAAIQQASILIDAPPESVYAVISDVIRTGEWSPECHRCRWVDTAGKPEPGARFRGYNRYHWLRWSRLNEVIVAVPGREFAFTVLPDWFNRDSSTWRYTLAPEAGGTRLTERSEVHTWPGFVVHFLTSLAGRPYDMSDNLETSLQRIKAIAEREAGG